ncbi:MAG: DNA methylase [Gemmatales bacterium]|nr:MAG: DNA methylase [Gemmatales bacterium]
MTDTPRLIEFAFPLKQASLDSVHEKNVRHGHISTLHIWPARRPLAACRAALIATLLPDPSAEPKPEGMSDAEWEKEIRRRRQELCEKIGGKVVTKIERKKMPSGRVVEREKEVTEGGILHWGRETENAETLQWFREQIKKAYGGRAPKVLDPFAGGGSIPLEAMRLGCEATAVDINPVAWFILKCTLEYPQKLAGQTRPLPDFILKDREFMEAFFKAQGMSKKEIAAALKKLNHAVKPEGLLFDPLTMEAATEDTEATEKKNTRDSVNSVSSVADLIQADLAWHVRAWGKWVLDRARRELAPYYPTYADFEPLDKKNAKPYEPRPMQLVPLKEDGTPDIDALNAEFSEEYLKDKTNPRWVAKPTVAYLWARTVTCKNCRATIPLLKTRWLCKKPNKRVLLTMEPNADKTGVVFGIETDVPVKGGNAAQRREHDKRIGAGTMSRAGAKCPCCGTIMTKDDIKVEGTSQRLASQLMVVVVDAPNGKQYREPTADELAWTITAEGEIARVYKEIPFGLPDDPITPDGKGSTWCIQYGLTTFESLFSPRQLIAMGVLLKWMRAAPPKAESSGYPEVWRDAIVAYLQLAIDRFASFGCTLVRWKVDAEAVVDAFARFGLPVLWDYAEAVPVNTFAGGFQLCYERIFTGLAGTLDTRFVECPQIEAASVVGLDEKGAIDIVVTDPPYYDAISYSAIMDFFYVWQRRGLLHLSPEYGAAFRAPLSPKWDHNASDGELVDDAQRFGGDRAKSKAVYEDGMARGFEACCRSLADNGLFVIVFANKQPDAWETLVAAIIRAGFVVDGSWPIETEMANRARALSSAALASSVWLVCKKRPPTARPGWDNKVLEEMRANIGQRLRDFWDAGIRGPDFVWAATGPALEAYSQHPVVKKADSPGEIMTVGEFLTHVRRMVVDFVVGRVLSGGPHPGPLPEGEGAIDEAATDRLDEVTAYYLLHRHDFGMDEAPVGACILYATACGLSDQELVQTWDLLAKKGDSATRGREDVEIEDAESDADDEAADTSSGSKVKLKTWSQRRGRSMGYEAPGGRPVPLIDRIHRLMHLWKAGDVHKVDEYLDEHGLRRQELFRRVLQSLIELAKPGSEERSLLESLSNHVGAKGAKRPEYKRLFEDIEWENEE